MKHIKVVASILESNTNVAELRIVEQSHIGPDFATKCVANASYFQYGEVLLLSWSFMEFVDLGKLETYARGVRLASPARYLVFLKGYDDLERDTCVLRIPANAWPKIKDAILAYNAFYA